MGPMLADKAILRSISNSKTEKNQIEDKKESLKPQLTILQKINTGLLERSQPCTEKQDYALVVASKPA